MATRSYGDKTHEGANMSRGHYPEDMSPSRGGYETYRSGTHDHGAHPRYLSNLARGRTSNFYINGDTFFPSKKVIYNPSQFKDFHNYLDYLTERLVPRFGAVRKICTPRHGGRIQDLGDLQDDGVYVVTGSEKFKPYRYDQIRPSDRRRSPAVNYNVEPVYHNRQFMSSGKIKKVDTQSILIKVWPNGGDLKGPHRVLISPRIRPYTLQNVITHVNELLKEDCLGTVEKLYFLSGSQVSEVEQIIPNGQYVACRRAERFKKARYNDQAVKNLSTSPRLDRKLLVPLFFARSVNGASQLSDQSQTSTQNSIASHTNRRRAPDDDDDDRVFPARPVKYKRDSEKVRTVDLDKDQGRLFKAKQPNHNTRGASEVPDSRRLKTDRPVDQWEAQEVDEDVSKRKDTRKNLSQRNGPRSEAAETTKSRQKPSTRSKEADGESDEEVEQSVMKIQAGYRGYKTRQEMTAKDAHKPSGSSGNKAPYAYNTSDREKSSSEDRFDEKETAAARIQAGYRGHQTRKTEHEKKAATKIQSSFRGYQDRKDLASRQEEPAGTTNFGRLADKADKTAPKLQDKVKGQAAPRRRPSPDREDSYDELDKENNAALTIQSHYRGYRTRQGVASRRSAAN